MFGDSDHTVVSSFIVKGFIEVGVIWRRLEVNGPYIMLVCGWVSEGNGIRASFVDRTNTVICGSVSYEDAPIRTSREIGEEVGLEYVA